MELPDDLIENALGNKLPEGWHERPESPAAQTFGGAWLRAGGAVALRLPSVIVPEHAALLVNPGHPQAVELRWSTPQRFVFDPRLF